MGKPKKKRGRPFKEQTMESVSVRVDLAIIDSIDLVAKYMTQKTGFTITRAQVIRKILIDNIDTYSEHATNQKRR